MDTDDSWYYVCSLPLLEKKKEDMEITRTSVLLIIGIIVGVAIADILIRRMDLRNMIKNGKKGIEPSRGQKYPIYLSIIFLCAFAITLILYYIYKIA
jgi:4-hydroxybenzoate polyprenyltransferase